MFLYDKDVERVMQAKKREVLKEIEIVKKRVLDELSNIDKATLTKFSGLLSDFNRINNLYEKIVNLDFVNINDRVEEKITIHYTTENKPSTKLSDYENEVKQGDLLLNTGGGFLFVCTAVNKENDYVYWIEIMHKSSIYSVLGNYVATNRKIGNLTLASDINCMALWMQLKNDTTTRNDLNSYVDERIRMYLQSKGLIE